MKPYFEKLKDPRWQKKRLEILNRDEWTCQFCGETEKTLHVHHIAYEFGEPWETRDRLLMTLCEDCHEQEGKDILEGSNYATHLLKLSGFTSHSFFSLAHLFFDNEVPDRGQSVPSSFFHILQTAIIDNEVWELASKKYNERLNEAGEWLMTEVEKQKENATT